MSIADQMMWVERLVRRPGDLAAALAAESGLDPADREVLRTIDPERLEAVSRTQALLVVARWWQARFPALLATLVHLFGDELLAARSLVGQSAFERAVDEDVTAAAIVGAVRELCAAPPQGVEVPPWLLELLAYEYLISTGLPRRGRGEPVCAETESALLGGASWLEGGRLREPVLCCSFLWPVGALQDEPHDAEPDPHTLVFLLRAEEAVEVEADDAFSDALGLLAAGADDAAIRDALGDEDAERALELLAELELLAG